MNSRIALVSLLLIFILPFASADLVISQLRPLYNLGDNFQVNITLSPNDGINGFFSAKIFCESGEIEIYKSPYNMKAGEQNKISLGVKLDQILIGNLQGSCFLRAAYGQEQTESQKFEISNGINVNLNAPGTVFDPGNQVSISGVALKTNGKSVEGFAELSISEINLTLYNLVKSGNFFFNVTLPNDIPASNYYIKLKVYEKDDSNSITNQGNASVNIKVRQVIREIDVAINKEQFTPQSNLSYTVLAYDQSGNLALADSSTTVTQPDESIILKRIVKSNEAQYLYIESNYSPGFWQIESRLGSLVKKKTFYVEEFENASFVVLNQTLIVTNKGNVPYRKEIEIFIGDSNDIKKVDLDVGESRRFKLLAPEGNYNIKVSDGSLSNQVEGVHLTGNAIAVKDLDNLELTGNAFTVFWIVLILVLLIIIGLYYLRVRKRRYYGKTPYEKTRAFSGMSDSIETKSKKLVQNSGSELQTLQEAVRSGNKEETAVVAFKTRNLARIIESESEALSIISSISEAAKESGAKVYEQGDFKVLIFSKSLIKKDGILLNAINYTAKIRGIIDDFNKKHAIKIDYGIGVNTGEMIVEFIGKKVKFTAVGNTTIAAKRAAEVANSEIIITRSVYRMISGKAKVEKAYGDNLFRLLNVSNRDKHSTFINRFMNRQK